MQGKKLNNIELVLPGAWPMTDPTSSLDKKKGFDEILSCVQQMRKDVDKMKKSDQPENKHLLFSDCPTNGTDTLKKKLRNCLSRATGDKIPLVAKVDGSSYTLTDAGKAVVRDEYTVLLKDRLVEYASNAGFGKLGADHAAALVSPRGGKRSPSFTGLIGVLNFDLKIARDAVDKMVRFLSELSYLTPALHLARTHDSTE